MSAYYWIIRQKHLISQLYLIVLRNYYASMLAWPLYSPTFKLKKHKLPQTTSWNRFNVQTLDSRPHDAASKWVTYPTTAMDENGFARGENPSTFSSAQISECSHPIPKLLLFMWADRFPLVEIWSVPCRPHSHWCQTLLGLWPRPQHPTHPHWHPHRERNAQLPSRGVQEKMLQHQAPSSFCMKAFWNCKDWIAEACLHSRTCELSLFCLHWSSRLNVFKGYSSSCVFSAVVMIRQNKSNTETQAPTNKQHSILQASNGISQ